MIGQKSNPNAPDGPLNYTCDGTLNVLTSSQIANLKLNFWICFQLACQI